jgi:hypothetical protein
MRRLFDLSMKTKYLHYTTKLSKEAREDIVWWLNVADGWNRRSVFVDGFWSTSSTLHIYTDASNLGIGAVCGHDWFS